MQPMTRRAFVGLGTAGAGAAGLIALGWDTAGAVGVQLVDGLALRILVVFAPLAHA